MKFFLIITVILVNFSVASAQSTKRLQWDIIATSLTEAQSNIYNIVIDNGAVQVVAHTCAGTSSPFQCSIPMPALTPGTHTVTIQTIEPVNGLESARSAPFSFSIPSLPTGLKIVG